MSETKKKNKIRILFNPHGFIQNHDVWLIEFYDGDHIVRTQLHSADDAGFLYQVNEFKDALDATMRKYDKVINESKKEVTEV